MSDQSLNPETMDPIAESSVERRDTIAVGRPGGSTTTPVKTPSPEDISDDGIGADDYPTDSGRGGPSRADKIRIVNQQMERNKAATHQFSGKYRNINVDNLRVGRGGGGGRNPMSAEDQLARTPNLQLFVPIEMPAAFNYRVAALVNSTRQGLLHLFLRHHDQFADFIPAIRLGMPALRSIQTHLDNIREADGGDAATTRLREFELYVDGLRPAQQQDLQTLLVQRQLVIRQFLEDNATYEQYMGEGVNQRRFMQVFFRVTDPTNNEQKGLVLGISNELYEPFPSEKKIRTLTTVFMVDNITAANNRVLVRSFQ